MEKPLIRIAVVDDHALMREGLIKQLAGDQEIQVIMEARHGVHMLQQLSNTNIHPDIAVIDLNMPVMDGFLLSEELHKRYPGIRILVLSAYTSDYNVAVMINNGACGYIHKDCPPTEFRKAIHEIYEKGKYFSELASEHDFKMLSGTTFKGTSIPDREMEFLKLCCTDLRYDQIAKEMGITLNTLDGCRSRLFDRLNINSRIALVLFAMRSGIVVNESYQPNNLKIKF